MFGVFNAGSSSLKVTLFSRGLHPELRIVVDNINNTPTGRVTGAKGDNLPPLHLTGTGHAPVLDAVLQWIEGQDISMDAAGHRIVHGGDFAEPRQLDAETLATLEALVPLAPLHQPAALAIIRALQATRPGLPQIGCFDTSFHQTQLPLAARLPLPRHLAQQGVRRYGFHGLSYQYITSILHNHTGNANGRVIVVHLGSGASACAILEGRAQASTMGMTALDGLMMGTRPGSLDPGVLLYLLQQGMTADGLQDMLYHQSGLKGVSGISDDMRTLLASSDPDALEAVDLFCFTAARQISGLIPALEGLDVLVFTGAIGANSGVIRARICGWLAWLGVELDHDTNHHNRAVQVSSPGSRIEVLALPTDEETVIAKAVQMMT